MAEINPQIPPCSGQDRLPVSEGQKIGIAGDTGTKEGWTHLHFQLNGPDGKPIDPYDLYKSRGNYPDPLFTNGNYCGKNYYWQQCPTEKVVSQKTVQPTPRATSTPIEPTSTPKVVDSQEAIINLGNWQIGITGWEEADYKPGFDGITGETIQITREGWKYVTVRTRLRNVGDNRAIGGYLVGAGDTLTFQIKADGFSYDAESLELELGSNWVPPGFSYPSEVNIWIPQIQSDYSLVVNNANLAGQVGEIPKGIQVSDFAPILPEAEIKEASEPWDVPGLMTVRFNRVYTIPEEDELYIALDFQNNYGQDIYTGDDANIEVQAYLKNGQVIGNRDYYSIPFEERTESVAPGLTKTKDVYMGHPVFDLKGSVIVLIYQDFSRNNLGGQWAAWQLP